MANETIERKIKPLSLGEAIAHADDVAGDCSTACRREHKQLADWLRELKNRRERGDCAKLRDTISTLRTALKEIRNDVLDMVMNHKSEDPDSYAHGLCLSIGGACDMALNSTKEFDNGNE